MEKEEKAGTTGTPKEEKATSPSAEQLQKENDDLKGQIKTLQKEIDELKLAGITALVDKAISEKRLDASCPICFFGFCIGFVILRNFLS